MEELIEIDEDGRPVSPQPPRPSDVRKAILLLIPGAPVIPMFLLGRKLSKHLRLKPGRVGWLWTVAVFLIFGWPVTVPWLSVILTGMHWTNLWHMAVAAWIGPIFFSGVPVGMLFEKAKKDRFLPVILVLVAAGLIILSILAAIMTSFMHAH